MRISTVFALSVAILSLPTVFRASVPSIVATSARMRAAMEFVTDVQDQLKNGDVARARRNVDAVLHNDPTFWPAVLRAGADFLTRGQIRSRS